MTDLSKLEANEVLAESSRRTGGLTELGTGPFVEPLALFMESLHRDAQLNELGALIASERALMHTVNRLNYIEDRKRFPVIAQQRIVKPVFIIGMPRTGTTILHDILAKDPANRAPMTWETMFPSPPPQRATFRTDPRIEQCAALFPAQQEQNPGFEAIHPTGPELTQECVVMMGEAMCTPLFHNQFRVPTFEDWVDLEADWSHVYDFHHMQLQHLQSGYEGDRWVLKTGAHLWGLEHLLATYPDARIVFTHRDPVKSMTSYASLTSKVRAVGSDQVDPAEVASDWIPRLQRVLTRSIRIRAEHEYPDAVFHDMMFRDFITDQFAVVEQIYDAFDIPMSSEGASAMQAFIDANPPGVHGVHRYTPEEYSIDPAQVRAEFREYIEHFELPPE